MLYHGKYLYNLQKLILLYTLKSIFFIILTDIDINIDILNRILVRIGLILLAIVDSSIRTFNY